MATHIDGGAVRTFNFASAISAYRFVEVHTDGSGSCGCFRFCSLRIGSTISDVAAGDNGAVKLFYPTFFATSEYGHCTAGRLRCHDWFWSRDHGGG
jgi:hypothetical protein